MAQVLNKSRILTGRVVIVLAFVLNLITRSHFPEGTLTHGIGDNLGVVLVCVCILGRVYCTLQIGGKKNAQLVTTGIYSVVRNPLYMFSFIGTLGIGLISSQLTIMALLIAAFLIVYVPLIAREEAYLSATFGAAYADYAARVPRLVPDPSLYRPPENVAVNISTLHGALRDALWWLLPFIVFESIELMQGHHMIKPMFTLW